MNRFFNLAIKILIAGLLAYVLYRQIWAGQQWEGLLNEFVLQCQNSNYGYLIIVLLLMPVNWVLETKKWQELCVVFEKIQFNQAFKAVSSGITLAVITPSRVGEYGGRMLFLKPEHKIQSVLATFVGSVSQNIHNVAFGMIAGLIFFAEYYPINRFAYASITGFSLLGILLMLIVFYRIELLILLIRRMGFEQGTWMTKVIDKVSVLGKYSKDRLSKVLFISLIRYMVYTTQYVLMLKFFGIEIPLLAGICGVAVIYLFQSGLPLPPIMGVLARGELALFIWSIFQANELSILSATFGLWIINLIIPALLGMLIILNVDVIKSISLKEKLSFTKKKLLK